MFFFSLESGHSSGLSSHPTIDTSSGYLDEDRILKCPKITCVTRCCITSTIIVLYNLLQIQKRGKYFPVILDASHT